MRYRSTSPDIQLTCGAADNGISVLFSDVPMFDDQLHCTNFKVGIAHRWIPQTSYMLWKQSNDCVQFGKVIPTCVQREDCWYSCFVHAW